MSQNAERNADMSTEVQQAKANRLRELHQGEGVLVLPNAWDALSARVFEDCGFAAIATTSAGIAFALGYPDGERLTRDEMVEATSRIASVVEVPVTADVEAGYGPSPEAAAETAREVIGAGAVGLNLEDAADPVPPGSAAAGSDASPLADLGAQLEKIRAVVEAGRGARVPLVVNARTDLYRRSLGDEAWRFGETVRRANAFLEAGADCVFVPGVTDAETISSLAREVAGPLNVLAGPGSPSTSELAGLGVRRVSVGSGPARAVMGLIRRMGRELLEEGTCASIAEGAIPYPEANSLFSVD
jgi:2-methylisocitrate lyase-like PEP mutase family enzyme